MAKKKGIQLLFDAEGTLFSKKGDPKEILKGDQAKIDIYFLGNPSPASNSDLIKQRAHEIVDRYNLGKQAHLDLDSRPNVYIGCDILCEVLLAKLGVNASDMNNIRAEIEAEVKDVRDPHLLDKLVAKYPEIDKIGVLTKASPYQESAYDKILSSRVGDDKKGEILLTQKVGYEKTDPTLYSTLVDKYGQPIAFTDDTAKNVDTASSVPHVHAEHYASGSDLYDTTSKAVESAIDDSNSDFDM